MIYTYLVRCPSALTVYSFSHRFDSAVNDFKRQNASHVSPVSLFILSITLQDLTLFCDQHFSGTTVATDPLQNLHTFDHFKCSSYCSASITPCSYAMAHMECATLPPFPSWDPLACGESQHHPNKKQYHFSTSIRNKSFHFSSKCQTGV